MTELEVFDCDDLVVYFFYYCNLVTHHCHSMLLAVCVYFPVCMCVCVCVQVSDS
jgi:hypothetical protein